MCHILYNSCIDCGEEISKKLKLCSAGEKGYICVINEASMTGLGELCVSVTPGGKQYVNMDRYMSNIRVQNRCSRSSCTRAQP